MDLWLVGYGRVARRNSCLASGGCPHWARCDASGRCPPQPVHPTRHPAGPYGPKPWSLQAGCGRDRWAAGRGGDRVHLARRAGKPPAAGSTDGRAPRPSRGPHRNLAGASRRSIDWRRCSGRTARLPHSSAPAATAGPATGPWSPRRSTRGTSGGRWRFARWPGGLQATRWAGAARIIAMQGIRIVHRSSSRRRRRAMRDRRALTVSLGVAGVAAMAVGLVIPAPRLLAQKPENPGAKAPAEPQSRRFRRRARGGIEASRHTDTGRARAQPATARTPDTGRRSGARRLPAAATTVTWTPEGTLADPEGAAKAFVEQLRRRRPTRRSPRLGKEAETLRARLQKVEAGLARWQSVKESLGSSATGRPGWRPRGGDAPTILEPIPPAGEPKQARPALPAGSRPAPEPVKLPESTPPVDPAAGASQPKGVVHVPPASRRGGKVPLGEVSGQVRSPRTLRTNQFQPLNGRRGSARRRAPEAEDLGNRRRGTGPGARRAASSSEARAPL